MSKNDKAQRLAEIKNMVHIFCDEHLTEELEGYAQRLCDVLGRKRKIDITRGKKEIWSASIIHAIARLNFLFDRQNENFITFDTICDFFNTKKTTIGSKATQIEKDCKLSMGAEGFCSKEISDMFVFYESPEGFIIPKSMIKEPAFVYEVVDGEEAEEIKRFAEEQRSIREKKRERRKSKKKKEKKTDDSQINLFDLK